MKQWVLKHPRILRIAKAILRPTPNLIRLDYGVFLAEKMAQTLPIDVDCVIGIPRSGLLFASIIATKRGLPLSTPECFTKGIIWQAKGLQKPTEYRSVLLVDDATGYGEVMDEALKTLRDYSPALSIRTASLIVSSLGKRKVEMYQMLLSDHKAYVYEWGIPHTDTSGWGGTCSDMDGVLCNDGAPSTIPNFELEAVITSRPESERGETERWLKVNGIRYKSLLMKDRESILGDSGIDHKVRCLKKIRPWWYWESSKREALVIAKQTHIPTLCFEDMKVYR